MKVALLVIGDEVLNGRTIDKNSSWLGIHLEKIGLNISTIRIIPDDKNIIVHNIQTLNNDHDLLITSGGVGPTKDDLTKECLAIFLNETISSSTQAEEIVIKNYQRFNKTWKKSLNNYNQIPPSVIPINNSMGLAPGLLYHKNNKVIFCAPGVPSEFSSMIAEELIPQLRNLLSFTPPTINKIIFRTYRIPEEKIFSELAPSLWEDLASFGKVSSLPQIMGVDIILTLKNQNTKNILENLKKINSVQEILKFTWQIGNTPLPQLIVEEAIKKKLTFSIAESCTGGLIASRITDIPGSSKVFMGGVISYSNESKENLINVSHDTLLKFGAVSEKIAVEMAEGVRAKLCSNLSISTSGITGPTGGGAEKPIGTIAIGISSENKTESKILNFPGNRLKLKERFSETALFYLLDSIREY